MFVCERDIEDNYEGEIPLVGTHCPIFFKLPYTIIIIRLRLFSNKETDFEKKTPPRTFNKCETLLTTICLLLALTIELRARVWRPYSFQDLFQ